MSATPRLDALTARGRQFLGSRHAILGGAMGWVSERHLVAAISEAGGFGVIACGAMTPELLRAEIIATRERTARPFGVNLVIMHPQLLELIAVCAEQQVGHVVLAGGIPRGEAVEAVRRFARLIAFAPNLALGRKLLRSGVDALVIEGSEAGGHIGPVSLAVLAQEILPELREKAIVFAAGGIGSGAGIAAMVEMGASGVQLGTRFAASRESIAHADFKRAFIRANARDAITTAQLDPKLPVIPVRALRNSGSGEFLAKQREMLEKVEKGELALPEAQLEIEHFWVGALRRAVIDGDVERGSVMAGQSVGMVKGEEPVAAIIDQLATEAEAALAHHRQPAAAGQ